MDGLHSRKRHSMTKQKIPFEFLSWTRGKAFLKPANISCIKRQIRAEEGRVPGRKCPLETPDYSQCPLLGVKQRGTAAASVRHLGISSGHLLGCCRTQDSG